MPGNRRTIRLKEYDYTQNGAYSVTICTCWRICYFGSVINGEMKLSLIGKIARKYWLEIPNHFPNVQLDEFIIMPNHIHGIIVIDKNDQPQRRDEAMPRPYTTNTISTMYTGKYPQMFKISPKPNSLSSIIGSYKSICTKQIRRLYDQNFKWQSRFYDHIIRDEIDLNRTREYIITNLAKWADDEYHV